MVLATVPLWYCVAKSLEMFFGQQEVSIEQIGTNYFLRVMMRRLSKNIGTSVTTGGMVANGEAVGVRCRLWNTKD